MAALSTSIAISKRPTIRVSSGVSLKSADECVGPTKIAFSSKGSQRSCSQRRSLTIQASYSDGGRSNDASIFLGGFVLGGLIVGTLGCIYAPQISKALDVAGAEKKEIMKKLPKFISDNEKVLEKQRKRMIRKLEQLNSAIDNISSGLRSGDEANGAASRSDDIEAVI